MPEQTKERTTDLMKSETDGLEKHIAECKGRKECFLMGEFGAKCQYAIPIKGKRSVTSDITYKCKKYEYSYVPNKEVDSQLK